ncbi:MAG TPA: hypothetical protein VMA77_03635 [Solirubrobacteraceae bacterium]|nr:hypothetical protein [Solirubrobacteraceae bacterium]
MKLMGTAGFFTSIVTGAIVWFVLYVIIGVALWISFVAGGGVALLGVLLAVGAVATHRASRHSPGHGGPLGAS